MTTFRPATTDDEAVVARIERRRRDLAAAGLGSARAVQGQVSSRLSTAAIPANREFGRAWVKWTEDLWGEFGGIDVEACAQRMARHDLVCMDRPGGVDAVVADGPSGPSAKTLEVIARAKRLNPSLRVAVYVQLESERKDKLTSDGQTSHLAEGGAWEGSTAQAAGAPRILSRVELDAWFDRFLADGYADGVFFDDWGYDWTPQYICWQMGYDESAYTTLSAALNQKWSDVIDDCHARGLFAITNGGRQFSVGDWYSRLTSEDVICIESCTISSAGSGTWNSGAKSVYDERVNYSATGKCAAKVWCLDYLPSSPTIETRELCETASCAFALAAGADYWSCGVGSSLEEPFFVPYMVSGQEASITKVSDVHYQLKCGGHVLEVSRPSGDGGAVDADSLASLSLALDGHAFANGHLRGPEVASSLGARVDEAEATVKSMTEDTRRNAASYWRLAIDDWSSLAKLGPKDYTSYAQTSKRSSAMNISGYSHSITDNEDGTFDLKITLTDYAYGESNGYPNTKVTLYGSGAAKALGIDGKTMELGVSAIEFAFPSAGDPGWTANTDHSGSGQWPKPGFCVYVSSPTNSYNPFGNNDGMFGYDLKAYRYVASDSSGLSFSVWIAPPTTGSAISGATVTLKGVYLVDVDEHADEITKDWWTQLWPAAYDVTSGLNIAATKAKDHGHVVYDLIGTLTDRWGWSVGALTSEQVTALRGHTLELGCSSMVMSDGTSGKGGESGAGGINFAVGIGVDPSDGHSPTKARIYATTSAKSSVWGDKRPCVTLAVPETATTLVVGMQSNGYAVGTTCTLKGVYLYDLGEEGLSIRGRSSTKSSMRVCRVTEEAEATDPSDLGNALYVSEKGDLWCTALDGTRFDVGGAVWAGARDAGFAGTPRELGAALQALLVTMTG
jgi:hypothetical protein